MTLMSLNKILLAYQIGFIYYLGMQLLKRNKIYHMVFYLDGKKKFKSTKTTDKRLAEKIAKKIEADIIMDKFGLPINTGKKNTLKDFIEKYLEYSKANKAPGTYEIDKYALNLFLDTIGDKNLKNITVLDCEKFKIERAKTVGKTTVNIDLRSLKSAFSSAKKWGLVNENPFKDIKQFKIQESNIPKYLTKKQIDKLLETIEDEKFKNIVLFYLYTGCRRNEALDLKWSDMDFRHKKVTFRITKAGKSRTVPINKKLYEILKNMSNGKSKEEKVFNYRPLYITQKFKKHLRKINVDFNKSIHILRSTFASHLVMNGVDIYTVQKLLGHSDISITAIYSHLAPDYLAVSVERLPY